jgi:hypothetical protein
MSRRRSRLSQVANTKWSTSKWLGCRCWWCRGAHDENPWLLTRECKRIKARLLKYVATHDGKDAEDASRELGISLWHVIDALCALVGSGEIESVCAPLRLGRKLMVGELPDQPKEDA